MKYSIRKADERILQMGMSDTVHNSFIALPLISLFEVIMIIRWFAKGKTFADPSSALHLVSYLTLLAASVATLLIISVLKKSIERNVKRIYLIQTIYAVLIVAWTLSITYGDSHYDGFFDCLVYVTIIIVVPVFCFLSPLRWTLIQLISTGAMMYLAHFHNGFTAFMINFSVFTIISVVAYWTLYRVRFIAYQRQIDLAEERDQSDYHAHHDELTDLPNRRSYIGELDRIGQKELDGQLILAMFDVNGLKQVNDKLGHDAGDDLLRGAASCLTKAFSSLGTIYRVGGDEYTGIFYGSQDALTQALGRFEEMQQAWQGR